jgi:hypothetical protein
MKTILNSALLLMMILLSRCFNTELMARDNTSVLVIAFCEGKKRKINLLLKEQKLSAVIQGSM